MTPWPRPWQEWEGKFPVYRKKPPVEQGSGRGTYLLLWLGWRVGRQDKRHTAEEKLMIKCGVVYKHTASEKGEWRRNVQCIVYTWTFGLKKPQTANLLLRWPAWLPVVLITLSCFLFTFYMKHSQMSLFLSLPVLQFCPSAPQLMAACSFSNDSQKDNLFFPSITQVFSADLQVKD